MKKAIFLDRDGVVNVDTDYVHKKEEFVFIDGLFEALKTFRERGFLLFVITNQSGIGRGKYTTEDFQTLTKWMIEELKKEDILISAVKFCPHKPNEGCLCRKPKPKMVLDLQEAFDLDLQNSWLIGDKESDIECAINAGVPNTILVRSGHKIDEENTKAKFIRNSVFDTIELIK